MREFRIDSRPAQPVPLALVEQVAQSMYASGDDGRRRLIELVFQVESGRYQILQDADWIAGLIGRLGVIWSEPRVWPENAVLRRSFEQRINRVSRRSGLKTQ